jgi:hypothetical protein
VIASKAPISVEIAKLNMDDPLRYTTPSLMRLEQLVVSIQAFVFYHWGLIRVHYSRETRNAVLPL